MKLPPLATTGIGSLPRPQWYAETRRNRVTFRVPQDFLDEAADDATLIAIREQERVGLDLLTDGEQRRNGFIWHVATHWDGIDTTSTAHKDVYRNMPADRMLPCVTGKVVRRTPATVQDLIFSKANTDHPVKMQVPGPMTVIDSSVNQAYSDESELAFDIAAALNKELLDLQAAGCDVIQIDEPAMTRYHDKVRSYGARALDRCLEGVTIPTIVHLCYGYPGGDNAPQHQYEYTDLLPELMTTRIGGFTVEFGRSSFDPEVLEVCRDRIVMFGCIDPGNTPAPSVDSVKRRIAGVLEHLDPSRVWLAPDCGLMTISRELARQKLKVMVEAASALRDRL